MLRGGQVSSGWWRRFLKRQKDLSLRQGDSTAHVRMDVMNRETMQHYSMSQKNVLISFNAIPFRSAKMCTKPECNITERRHRPFAYRSFSFRFVSFRTVPRSTARSRNAALLVEERLPRLSACRFPATFFTLLAASWLPLGYE